MKPVCSQKYFVEFGQLKCQSNPQGNFGVVSACMYVCVLYVLCACVYVSVLTWS